MDLLILSLVALGVGPLTHLLFRNTPLAVRILDIGTVIAVGALVLFHVVPEAFEQAGMVAIAPLVVGLLLPTIIERGFVRLENQAQSLVMGLLLVGLLIHALLDGAGMVISTSHEFAWAVVLHRVPVGLFLWWLVRPTYGLKVAVTALCLEGFGTLIGYFLAPLFVELVSASVVAGLQAFVAGSLLHVVVDRHDYHAHQHH